MGNFAVITLHGSAAAGLSAMLVVAALSNARSEKGAPLDVTEILVGGPETLLQRSEPQRWSQTSLRSMTLALFISRRRTDTPDRPMVRGAAVETTPEEQSVACVRRLKEIWASDPLRRGLMRCVEGACTRRRVAGETTLTVVAGLDAAGLGWWRIGAEASPPSEPNKSLARCIRRALINATGRQLRAPPGEGEGCSLTFSVSVASD